MKPNFDGGFEDLSFNLDFEHFSKNQNCDNNGFFDKNSNCRCANCDTNCNTNELCGEGGIDTNACL